MGYTTKFTGCIKLSRQLTLAEARELLVIAEDNENAYAASGINSYLQWVPSESLDEIVWDGGEKFYDYEQLLRWLCSVWLLERGIVANGELLWSGEEAGDVGVLTVVSNVVSSAKGKKSRASGKPLTLSRLGELALDAITTGAQS